MRSSGEDSRRGRTSHHDIVYWISKRKHEYLILETFAKTLDIPSGTPFPGGAADRSAHSAGPDCLQLARCFVVIIVVVAVGRSKVSITFTYRPFLSMKTDNLLCKLCYSFITITV